MQISSPLGGLAGFNQAIIGVLQSTSSQQLDKSSSGADTSSCNQTNTFLSACPRVYCLSKSGNLLLSNTGLLGIVCLCHSMHMPVSKFCENSGLHAINPGEAVGKWNDYCCLEKARLPEVCIKAAEDQSGWDWPQWYSINAELVKYGSELSNSYDLSSSPKSFVLSGRPWENASFPTNVHSSEILPKWVQHRDNEDKCNFDSKSLTLTTPHGPQSVLIGCPVPRSSTRPKFVGSLSIANRESEDTLQCASLFSDSFFKCRSSYDCQPTLQYLKTSDEISKSRNFSNLTAGQILDTDTFFSNIELKLGQPYQQSQTMGHSSRSCSRDLLLDSLGFPPKAVPSVHLIVNKDNAVVLEKTRQYPLCAASTSDSRERTGKIESKVMNYAFQSNNAAVAAQFRNDTTVVQDGLLNGHGNATVINSVGISTVSTANQDKNVDFHISKSPPCTNSLKRDASLGRFCMVNEASTSGQVSNRVSGGFSFSKLGCGSQSNSSLSGEADVQHGNLSGFTLYGKNSYLYQSSGVSPNESDVQNDLNYSGVVPCSGNGRQKNESLPRPSNLTSISSSRLILPPSEVSMGSSSSSSLSPRLIPSLASKETFDGNLCMMNKHLKTLTAKHMSERVPGPGSTSIGENPEIERLSNFSYAEKLVINPSTTLKQRHYVSTKKLDFSEPPLKSFNYDVAGFTNCDNISSSSQEFPLSSKQTDMPHKDSHDILVNKPISRRLEASRSNILSSYEDESILKSSTNFF